MKEDKNDVQDEKETLPSSPEENETADELLDTEVEETNETKTNESESEEEKEWSNLSGKAQERFRQAIREKNEARSRLTELEKQVEDLRRRPASESALNTDEEAAIKMLRELGVVTRNEAVTKEDLQAIQDRMTLDREHDRLEEKYKGDNGRPAYIKEEIEEYARKKGIYNLEAAYRDMFFDELIDFGKEDKTKKATYSERPKSAPKEQPLSAESITERLKRPDGREWWEKNRDKIL